MAKGLLFALVRRGSKLNYLDETGINRQSEREGNVRYEKAKLRFQASAENEMKGNNAREGNDSQHAKASKEGRRTRKKLFDLTLQKLSKGCKMNGQSPSCSNTDTILKENAFGRGEIRSVHRNKPMLVPSVACGYFVNECNSASKETISTNHEKNVPRFILTDHENGSTSACKSIENCPRVQYSRYAGSLPQLRPTRPSTWKGDSSSKLNDFTDRKSKTTVINGLEAEQSPGFRVEFITISMSPTVRRKNLRSANSLDPKGRQLTRTGSSIERSEMHSTSGSNCEVLSLPTKEGHFVKRAESWSRGDEKVNDFISARQNRKIDIFLPTM